MRLRVLLGSTVALAAAAALAGALVAAGGDEDEPDRGSVIALVDGDPVYEADALARIESLSSVHEGSTSTVAAEFRQQILQSLVDDVIARQEAARRDLEVTDEEVEKYVADVKALVGSEKDFKAWLKEQKLTMEALERRAELQVLWGEVNAAVVAGVKVSDADVEEYYQAHQEEFTVDGVVTPFLEVRNDLTDTVTSEKRDQAFRDWLVKARTQVKVEVVSAEWGDPA